MAATTNYFHDLLTCLFSQLTNQLLSLENVRPMNPKPKDIQKVLWHVWHYSTTRSSAVSTINHLFYSKHVGKPGEKLSLQQIHVVVPVYEL